ncbi:MAG: hypothetical protein ABNH26_08715 [Celeribacter sp.]|jgi:hypothetical protein
MARPTKYQESFCEDVEATMREGFSKMAAAGRLGVCYNTVRAWMEEHPEFLQAVKRGEAARAEFLERGLLSAETGPQVTSRIFALKNAAPDEWRDKHDFDHTSRDGSMTPKPSVIELVAKPVEHDDSED